MAFSALKTPSATKKTVTFQPLSAHHCLDSCCQFFFLAITNLVFGQVFKLFNDNVIFARQKNDYPEKDNEHLKF